MNKSSLRTSLATIWSASAPLGETPQPNSRLLSWDRRGAAVAWPLAVLLSIHRVFVLALNGSVTDDFSTVYSAARRFFSGQPVYNELYQHVDPHYLYSPGATVLLSPLGMIPHFALARTGFILLNALAIMAALAILTRLAGFRLAGAVWPATIAGAMLTESVRNTLIFSNINGVLLLALAAFLAAFLHDRPWLAGLILGLAIVIKPQFLPLLFLPIVKLQWQPVVAALAIPGAANAAGFVLLKDAGAYFTTVLPYLGEVRDYANSSLPGMAAFFGMPEVYRLILSATLVTLGGAAGIILLRWRNTDPLLWASTTTGLLLTGVFVLSNLGQMYYSMLLFPWMFTVFLRRSVFHSTWAWVAAFLFLFPETWMSPLFPAEIGRWISYFSATAGWSLVIIATAGVVFGWNYQETRRVEKLK